MDAERSARVLTVFDFDMQEVDDDLVQWCRDNLKGYWCMRQTGFNKLEFMLEDGDDKLLFRLRSSHITSSMFDRTYPQ